MIHPFFKTTKRLGLIMLKAAGIVFLCEDSVLLAKRPEQIYSIFGGHVELGETDHEAAIRELVEEAGIKISFQPNIFVDTLLGMPFRTYLVKVNTRFKCYINHEHESYGWFKLSELPSNLHQGVRLSLTRFGLI